MSEQQADPRLTQSLWATIKEARDDAMNRMEASRREYEHLEALLARMRDAGMADHLPTIEEVQEAWANG